MGRILFATFLITSPIIAASYHSPKTDPSAIIAHIEQIQVARVTPAPTFPDRRAIITQQQADAAAAEATQRAAEALAESQAIAAQQAAQAAAVVVSSDSAKAFIYSHESGNNPGAINASSGACSLGQALPCSKLAAACPNWRTDYACDDAWFTQYMLNRYGSWPAARAFWEANSWW